MDDQGPGGGVHGLRDKGCVLVDSSSAQRQVGARRGGTLLWRRGLIPGRDEDLVAMLKGALQVELLLTLFLEFGLGVREVEGGEGAALGRVDAERFGQPSFEVLYAPLQSAGVFVQAGVVGRAGING
ncbi:hypothetical protein [Micromonospora sp. CPCC 205556]|uniref:hypothetical protein n=1 Tax=Micromonospora sp. CPCC 205556 TaxID=3122398 RepID=UPI002FF42D9A